MAGGPRAAGKGERVGPEHLARALELREALRRTMLANNGGPEEQPATSCSRRRRGAAS